jgi:hypothetical protein
VILGIGVGIFFIFSPSATQSVISGILISALISLVIAQVYRYRRVSTPTQRQQTKWVVYSLAVTIITIILGIPVLIVSALVQNGSLFSSVANIVANALLILLPISFGVAILRYRLWDIDVLINRTLVYGALTASLAFVYFVLIFALQYPLRGLINQKNDVAIVVSTLAIYALFQPLRRRIQNIIDRRFYRRKYDAAKIVATFSSTLRQEVDLDTLREQFIVSSRRRCSQRIFRCGYALLNHRGSSTPDCFHASRRKRDTHHDGNERAARCPADQCLLRSVRTAQSLLPPCGANHCQSPSPNQSERNSLKKIPRDMTGTPSRVGLREKFAGITSARPTCGSARLILMPRRCD